MSKILDLALARLAAGRPGQKSPPRSPDAPAEAIIDRFVPRARQRRDFTAPPSSPVGTLFRSISPPTRARDKKDEIREAAETLGSDAPENAEACGQNGQKSLDAWRDGVGRLIRMPCPRPDLAPEWATLGADALAFLDAWGDRAAALGWPSWALWGVHRDVPASWRGRGLIALLGGPPGAHRPASGVVVDLTADVTTIRVAGGHTLTYRPPPRDPLVRAERCLLWEIEPREGFLAILAETPWTNYPEADGHRAHTPARVPPAAVSTAPRAVRSGCTAAHYAATSGQA